MPLTPSQIKDKLINALDNDKNIIDEKAVEEVITLLEASNITKEILEQTRLGRDINDIRKTSKNPVIAKRAKNLVKSWKKLITPVANGQHPAQKISPGLSPAVSISNATAKNLPSPALINARQQALKTAGPVRSPIVQPKANQQVLPTSKLAQPEAKLKQGTDKKSPMPAAIRQSQRHGNNCVNDDSNFSWPGTPPSTISDSSQDRLIGDRENQDSSSAGNKGQKTVPDKRNFNFDNSHLVHSAESTAKSLNRASDQREVSKTNIANRKRARPSEFDDSNDSSVYIPSSKQPHLVSSSPSLSTFNRNDVINGTVKKKSIKSPRVNARDNVATDFKIMVSSSSRNSLNDQSDASMSFNRSQHKFAALRQDSVDSRISDQSSDSRRIKEKHSKVKTTEQLLEDMQKRLATTVDTNVIAQLRTNQMKKDTDTQKIVLPSGSKHRGRKKKQDRGLPDTESASDGRKLAQTKNEYIERFLLTSVAPVPGEDAFEHSLPSRQDSLDEHHINLGGCSSSFSQSVYDPGFSYSGRQDKPDSGPSASPPEARDISEVMGSLPSTSASLESSVRLSEEQVLARLPPIDYGNIDWTMHDYPAPQELPVTAGLVDRLHKDNIPGLNGTYDYVGQFKKWHETLTLDTVNGEPLYILPYVIPND
ncbi:mediator of RNA polymerase II transcription subunit 26 [Biomphalaria pfeifferi]|uniref:Mediator of RNA polymerase II transcription subunit 26 n=1 Tax=Biomphalaria pfeifferi TaxID=112525 RepID=A0AAD8AZU6_BIOPF|nr:mediator of RNA polymerase II transcription subunit 26 [Biomphalaria pfeifferi]